MRSQEKRSTRVAVVGMGYVGIVTAACLTRLGMQVIGVERDAARRSAIAAGTPPIREPGLDRLIAEARSAGTLSVVENDREALERSDTAMICVGTPSDASGNCDVRQVEAVMEAVAEVLARRGSLKSVMLRSTVPPGTSAALRARLEEASGRVSGTDFSFAFVPEFLREGSAVEDFFNPPQTAIGADDPASRQALAHFWRALDAPITHMTAAEAETLKYACNAWHAVKIAFANEIGRLGTACGFDAGRVMAAFVQDEKLNISPAYLKPGFAYGGSCLPKDLRAVAGLARQMGVAIPMIEHVEASNRAHIASARDRVSKMAAPGQRVALFGLTFKPGTNDLRESAGATLLQELRADGYQVCVVDPMVEAHDAESLGAELASTPGQALCDCAIAVVLHADGAASQALARTGTPVLDYRPASGEAPMQRLATG